MTGRLDPAGFPGAFAYEHSDLPPNMTLAAWRAQRAAARRAERHRRWTWRLRRYRSRR